MSWICVRVQPRRERWACQNIERQGVATYCPYFREPFTDKIKPLFSSYVFALLIAKQWWFIKNTFGVSCLIMHGEHPAELPDRVIAQIKQREGSDGIIELPKTLRYRLGQKLRITQGPLQDQIGLYAGEGRERIRVLLTMLGAPREVEIAAVQLQAVS